MAGWKRGFQSEFVPEWRVLAILAVLDVLWARAINLHVGIGWGDFMLPALALSVMAGLRMAHLRRGGLMAEYFALSLVTVSVVCVLSYVCLASAPGLVGPLADTRLMAMDRALGFDWISGYRFVQDHPALRKLLGLCYGSLCYQGLYFCVLLAVMNQRQRLREMFWLVLGCSLLACAGALLVPALGPAAAYGIGMKDGFIPVMQHLISGRDLNFALAQMTGVVSFPSFHTAMALAYAYAFRNTGPIGWAVAALNAVMLCAIPFFGGHYLSDMIAGAAAMLVTLAVVKTAPALWRKPEHRASQGKDFAPARAII